MNCEPPQYFGLTFNPFGEYTPEWVYYETKSAKEAIRDLYFFLAQRKGIGILIGEDGIGKTSVLKKFCRELNDRFIAVFVKGNDMSEQEIVKRVWENVESKRTEVDPKDLKDALRDLVTKLIKNKKECVLAIDDAHFLNDKALFFLSHLSSIQFFLFRPFHIILSGNNLLFEKLKEKKMENVVKKISMIHIMKPMRREEVRGYINQRLNFASSLFLNLTERAIDTFFSLSGGNPLRLNVLLEKAISLAAKRGTYVIDRIIAEPSPISEKKSRILLPTFILFSLLLFLIFLLLANPHSFLEYWAGLILRCIEGILP